MQKQNNIGGKNLKNIAVLLSSIPESGGEHQYLSIVMEGLLRCNGKQFNILGICYNRYWIKWCREHKVEYMISNMEEYPCKKMIHDSYFIFMHKCFNAFFLPLGKVIRQKKIDLLICGQQSVYVPPVFCKIIRPVHDLMHRYEGGFEEISSTYEEREALFCSTARFSNVILVDSKVGRKQYIESYCKRGKHNPKVKVLPFTVPDHIVKQKEEYIDTPDKYIFYPAQFWEHKNHKNLLLAINLLKKKNPDIHLILVGSERNSLKKIKGIIKKYQLEKNVSILGFVKNEQITYLYKHAVALIMPSFAGPTNIPPLEAMALGCPVIVSNNYAMGEQVGSAGLLCDPYSPDSIAQCISQVWNDDKLCAKMKAEGLKRSLMWTPRDFTNRFIHIVLEELKK